MAVCMYAKKLVFWAVALPFFFFYFYFFDFFMNMMTFRRFISSHLISSRRLISSHLLVSSHRGDHDLRPPGV
ncbi:hypothetical protein TRV_06494 [Trichophyton verrucosum HKI 0517]|uniref:Uncharacterized protein n=1 Tax=Trichophyton verrucosum (strain HKI 0517) TaxID=663202 RepID=D4DH39_TRIVH|nr:uncharacterized protein TRV_06494 [Trichophyton verrucosum HKI 0517]EFE38834.1 hypothetical protein TRV_06494 [Trichophyton verrucosum HKI 0517]